MASVSHQAVPRPAISGQLQRKCACGASRDEDDMCEDCKAQAMQRKLAVGASNDPLEFEADRIAEDVVSGSRHTAPMGSSIRAQRAHGSRGGVIDAPASVDATLAGPATALSPLVRADMERRFGYDFSDVRVHADAAAARSAHDISAHAYTVGRDIVFGSGRLAPETREGRHLIAHELAHVVQQGGASETIRRDDDDFLGDLGLGDLVKAAAKWGEDEVRAQLRALGALPGTGAVFSTSGCPSNFCNPFKDVSQAKRDLMFAAPFLLTGIAMKVSRRVVPLWKAYLFGGSPERNISSDFAADFTASSTTKETTNFIVKQMKKEIAAKHKAIMGSAPSVAVDLTSRMSKTLAAIDKPSSSYPCPPKNGSMNFCDISEIPGNIAGNIGKDQLSTQIGAQPSPVDDRRSATISAQLTRTPSAITVKPAIDFEVKDTIDLCPGNCGAATEQDATIPMSRFEATGLSGDVPFTVQFPAPASALGEFAIPLAKGKPSPGKSKTKKSMTPKKGKGKATPGAKGASLGPTESPVEAVAANAIEEELDTNEELIADEEDDMDGEKGMLQAKLAVGFVDDPLEHEADSLADLATASSSPGAAGGPPLRVQRIAGIVAGSKRAAPPSVDATLAGPATALSPLVLADMERRFGYDFSDVRVHADAAAARSARDVSAHAYTVGRDIVFGAGHLAPGTPAGRRLLAHELTHVIQQGFGSTPAASTRGPVLVQRYEAGEHAKLGETGAELRAAVAARSLTYKVKPGEHLEKIARKYGISVKELTDANQSKVQRWKANRPGGGAGGGDVVVGFSAGETITIPPVLNEFTKEGLKNNELVFTLNGVQLSYGEGIAMGDFYEDAAQMLAAPDSELKALASLIDQETKSGKWVTPEQWDEATNNRFTKLAEKNEAHFASSNPSLVAVSTAPHGSDNKTEWEKAHKAGLDQSQKGAKQEALQINAYGDHFLTDAFSAGHLINKRDVMEMFKGGLTKNAAGEFIGDAKALFDKVATAAFVGNVKTEFSKYETVASYNRHGKQDPSGWFHPSINDARRFSSLLQSIQDKEPDALSSVVAKSVHDTLSTTTGGVPVENAKGDKWPLSGDKTLNAPTIAVARKAVAQSQLNIFDAFKFVGPLYYPAKFKAVWDYVPRPTTAGETTVKAAATSETDPKSANLVKAIVALINSDYVLILRELVARKHLRKA